MAVLAVLGSHAFSWAHGGFLGVDVFFVLSGYLITSLLLRERALTGEIDFLGFYRRRVARLAPAYLVMLFVAVPIMLGPLSGAAHWPVPLAVAASVGYAGNWVSVADVDALGPIVHTWSLSIEEQFYLLWPAAFVFLCRGRRSLRRWLAAGIALVVVVRLIGWQLTESIWPYFATITHADGLLAGALLAVVMAKRPVTSVVTETGRRRSGLAAAAGAVLLAGLAAVLSVDDGRTYLAGLTLAVAGMVTVLRHVVITPAGRLAQVLCWRPLVGIGRISYGVYLYHLPIFQLVQARQLGFLPTLALEVGGTFALALASWFGVERPAQRWAGTTVLRPFTRRIAVRAVA